MFSPWSCPTLCDPMDQASLYITISQGLHKLVSIELVMVSNHLILYLPLLLLPSVFPSIRVFSNKSALHVRWPKYWSFCFSISPCYEYSGLISFRIDSFDLPVVQGTLKSLLQNHRFESINSSVLSLLYGPTLTSVHVSWKNHSFDYMDLCQQSDVFAFNILSRFVIALLPRRKCLLILWLQSPSTVILDPNKIKAVHFFPIYLPWSDGTGCHDLTFLNVES